MYDSTPRVVRPTRPAKTLLQSVGPKPRQTLFQTPYRDRAPAPTTTTATTAPVAAPSRPAREAAPSWLSDWQFPPASGFQTTLSSKTWTLFACSPWHQFRPSRAKAYIVELTKRLNAELASGSGGGGGTAPFPARSGGGPALTVEQVTLNYVDGLDELLGSFLYFEIRYTFLTPTGLPRTTQALAIFTATDDYRSPTGMDLFGGATSPSTIAYPKPLAFPLMLFKGPAEIRAAFTQWIQNRFDCRISALTLNRIQMTEMVLWWTHALLDHLAGLDEEGTAHDSKTSVLDLIEAHFETHMQIKVHRLTLELFGTGMSCLTASGKLKFIHTAFRELIPFWLAQICALVPGRL
ncbi:hypothetical protein BJ085DRAFT_35918 [Dimargaris cristalligena]|uniref:Centromere protein L n=1 Tax=Dimargaris cristalligena TaxID=215637 RepID=A0A4P9ZL89_9FUNG|nr:hypothetical protein BJ085DRAFT_35918 [Dimargaris cristalligena]|eukprot:RKP34054.1 hypothetical protein BJ085DRAFT_35918 [Dimargaris cristalligena]